MIPITSVEERADGFAAGVKAVKTLAKSTSWVYCEDLETIAEAAVRQMLDSPKPPSVILTSNNDMLLAVLKVAGERGLSIGKDLSVISFDDSPWAAAMKPGITVVARPVEELGSLAVKELVSNIEGKVKPKQIVLPAHLIKRGSVSRLRQGK